MTPRLMIAAMSSGAGKTTVTCAVLQAYQNRGLSLMACKSGPDYIDPMFHSRVIGTKSRNLDLFFFSPELARALLRCSSGGCEMTVLEGAMGFYDGIGVGSDASAWDLAGCTETPVILIADGRGAALSAAAAIHGFQTFRPNSRIAGIILNRCSSMMYPRLAACITRETGLPVFGYLPMLPDCAIESRHLGLMTADEVKDIRGKLARLADAAEASIDLDGLLRLAHTAPELTEVLPAVSRVSEAHPRIAVAKDRAFCFYYQDSLELLEQLGAELVPFSPLADRKIPDHAAGLYLGGGYPELYAKELSRNTAMRDQIRDAVSNGIPTVAECGGFLYLHRMLEDKNGVQWPMAGVLPADAYRTDRLRRFGYITMTAKSDGLLFKEGESVPAHEFHYWDSGQPGTDFRAEKPQSTRSWEAGISTPTLYAGFPHFHFCSKPEAAARFVRACAAYQENIRHESFS